MPPQIGSGLGRPCLRSFGLCPHRERLMRPVRAAGSRWGGFPKSLIRRLTAPAQDHGPSGVWRSQIPRRCQETGTQASRSPGFGLWSTKWLRRRGSALPATRTLSRTRRPPRSASAGAAPVARSPLCPDAAPVRPKSKSNRIAARHRAAAIPPPHCSRHPGLDPG